MATISLRENISTAAASIAATNRNAALDRARTFITMLVLVHHSVIAYTHFGHTDKQSFLGFDGVVLFNDSFFMAAMFMLSGLFVWPSLQRKGVIWFLRDRWWRLGFPFAICAVALMPVAYYAIEARLYPEVGFGVFWRQMVTIGPWPSGPAWFVIVLLGFDVGAAAAFALAPRCMDALGRLSLASKEHPELFVGALLIGSIAVYVPAVLYFGASRWFAAGPLAVQASRILLYLLYFVFGIGIGVVGFDKGVFANDGNLAHRWPLWLSATIISFVCIVGLIGIRHNLLPDVENPPLWWQVLYALSFASYSAAQTVNVVALFLRFSRRGNNLLDPLRDSAYGIYLVHYVPVLWMQYALFGLDLTGNNRSDAILKAAIVLTLTLLTSWSATLALRHLPGAKRVL